MKLKGIFVLVLSRFRAAHSLICIYTNTHIYTHVHKDIIHMCNTNIYVCIYVYIYIYIYIYMHICASVFVFVCVCVCVCVYVCWCVGVFGIHLTAFSAFNIIMKFTLSVRYIHVKH